MLRIFPPSSRSVARGTPGRLTGRGQQTHRISAHGCLAVVANGETAEITSWIPTLNVDETDSGCRLTLGGVTSGHGATLQDAADDLIARLLNLVMVIRSSGLQIPSELGPPHPQVLQFLWEIGEMASRGEDIRQRVFTSQPSEDPAH